MTLGNRILRRIHRICDKVLVWLHGVLYTPDQFHPTTNFREGKKCVNICSYCGDDNTADGGVWMPAYQRTKISPIHVRNVTNSDIVVYPQVLEASEIIALREDRDVPLVCRACGRYYSSALVMKALDINVIMYF